MEPKNANREKVLELLEEAGCTTRADAQRVQEQTGIPEADVFGAGTFYTLLDGRKVARVCQGLSCKMAGSDALLAQKKATTEGACAVSCLGQCDRAPVALTPELELEAAQPRGAVTPADDALPMNLAGPDTAAYPALKAVRAKGPAWALSQLKDSGLQGRGGAGFPAFIKWKMVSEQAETERYIVCNADEGEPGTFKDREIIQRRPHLLLEGLAIAAVTVGARDIYIYIRGEFRQPRRWLEKAIAEAEEAGVLQGLQVLLVAGHGAYICGEETALLEAMEGRRGMPRIKPPYPTEKGFRGKPTLMNNVETLACVPAIIQRGGPWFKELGRDEAGSKLYCVSGHVQQPGVYELPLGVTIDELVQAAGGYVGQPLAFSPGGASSGFLPMSLRDTPLDFGSLAKVGSMLGSAGVVVLNDTVDLAQAAQWQAVFFEDETCGQCAPCRIGTQLVRRSIDKYLADGDPKALSLAQDMDWEMEEGSICGLGMVAAKPLTSAMKHFPEQFGVRGE